MTRASAAIHRAGVEIGARFIHEPVLKAVLGRCFVIGRHKFFGADGCDNLAEVEESHVGAFVAGIPDSRHVGLYILFDKRVVVVHVGIGLIKPLTAVFVSSLGSHNAQCADIGPVLLINAAGSAGLDE